MRPILRPELVNGDTGDPLLYLDLMFLNRALLIDLGDCSRLPPKKLLRITDIFVSHTHMDHFIGFDRLLRVCLGRGKRLRIHGGPGIIRQVEAKLAAYTWNLVENYSLDFVIEAIEIDQAGTASESRFRCRNRFVREFVSEQAAGGGVLLDEAMFRVRCCFLDHGIPCLAFLVEEKAHFNIWKNRLHEMGLATGPWLKQFKQAVCDDRPDDFPIEIPNGESGTRTIELRELREAVRVIPGQKIAYVTDAAHSDENRDRIRALAKGADILFIEAVFLDQDAGLAGLKHHLTARQAGAIAREAGVALAIPFHFSPRYSGREPLLRIEVANAFG